MEKVNFENNRGLELVGNFWEANSDVGVVMAHGFTGNKEEWGRFTEIAECLNKSGFNVLSFDFSGCGESDDDSITVEKEIGDLDAAVSFLESKVSTIGILALSQGGLITLKRDNSDVDALVLMAPVSDALKDYRENKLSKQQREDLKQKGYTVKTREKGKRDRFVIPEKLIDRKENIDQDELLEDLDIPVFFLHGKGDETVPIEHSRNAVSKLRNAELTELECDHYFEGKERKISESAVKWFEKHLKVSET